MLTVTITTAVFFGLVMTLPLCLRPALMQYARLTEAGFARLWAVFNLGLMPFLLLAGLLLDIWGSPVLLTLGSTCLMIGCLLLIYHSEARAATIALLFWGAGAACLCVASVTWMPYAFFTAEELPAALNFGLVFFALGALIAPTFVEVLLRGLGWQRGLGLLAILSILPPVLAWVLRAPLPSPPSPAQRFELFGDPVLWLATAAFFLYAPLEGTVSAWFTRWVRDLGHEPRDAGNLLTAFWAAFLMSRLFVAYLLHCRVLPFPEVLAGGILAGMAFLASIFLANLSSTMHKGRGTLGVLTVGLLLGPIFPTLLALVMGRFPGEPGLALGTVVGFGSLGSLLLVPIIGVRIRQDNAHQLMRFVMLIGLTMAGFVIWFTFAL